MKIALMCPTRNRLNKLLTLISSLITTVNNSENVVLVLGVDEDDPIKDYYVYLQRNVPLVRVIELQNNGKFLGLSTMWNTMAKQVTDVDVYAMIGDDMIFKTKDWDVEVKKEFDQGPKDKIMMLHCNDGMRGPGNKYENVAPFCVNFFVHKNYVNTAGYFVEPYIENIHEDTWAMFVFSKLNRVKYRHDILIKHLHQSESNSKSDNVTDNLQKLRENIWNNNDWMITYKSELEDELNKLKKFIKDYNNG